MKTQHWIYLLILIVILTIIVGFFSSLFQQTTPSTSVPQQITTTTTLQEVNQVLFDEYFSELTTAKIPLKVQEGAEPQPVKTQTYTAEDQICIVGKAKKDIPANTIETQFYSRDPEYFIGESPFNIEIHQGAFASCADSGLPSGKYNLKIFMGDSLISVLPFDVTE
ncbi:MAG: hypothetical protein KBG30_11920 [Bacteroidales bacterium]|nr:hypothetical protein [Bacteroidales bacterium]OQA44109.1 MAG: hypothetical protein BWY48_00285 [Parcubacteria group bacterium ADurb.Bin305]